MQKKTKIRKYRDISLGKMVRIISGKYKNQEGEITQVIYKSNKITKIVVDGINLKTKHLKSTNENELGKISQISLPIDVSNVKAI